VDKVMVFVDGSNAYRCLRSEMGRTDFHLGKLADKLVQGRHLIRTYYYTAPVNAEEDPQGATGQQRFFAAVKNIPYVTLRLGKLVRRNVEAKCPGCGRVFTKQTSLQKGVDALIVMDMLEQAWKGNYDIAVLISGDGDLAQPVQSVKSSGKQVENAFTNTGWARELRDASDKRILLDKAFMGDCWL